MDPLSRRRLLQVGGAGTTLTLAGCNALSDTSGVEESSDDPDASDDAAVTVAPNIDQEAMMEVQAEMQEDQQELQEQLEEGEIDEEEFEEEMMEIQAEAQEIEAELVGEAVEAIEGHVADTDGISVADSSTEAGLVLVDGEAEPLIGLLTVDAVQGLLAEEQFEELQQPAP